MNMKRITAALAGLSLIAFAVSAKAHGSMKPLHGGVVTMVGETVVELVRAPKGVDVYITEEDEPLAATGFSGKLIVTATACRHRGSRSRLVPRLWSHSRPRAAEPRRSLPSR